MAQVFDFALDESFDIKFRNGDFDLAEGTEQHILLILATSQGHWRQTPLLGADYQRNYNTNRLQNLNTEVKKHLELDGMNVNKVSITQNKIVIDGEYSS